MSIIKRLTTLEQWEEQLQSSRVQPLFVFKHSTSCPVSAEAFEEFESFVASDKSDYTFVVVHVIESRPVSNRIAESLDVKHESPQALLVKDGQVVWHASHFRITKQALEDAMA